MQRVISQVCCYLVVAVFTTAVVRAQSHPVWSPAPQPGASGLLEVPSLGGAPHHNAEDRRWVSGRAAPIRYSNAPYPNLQQQPYAATTPPDHLAYPGQVPAQTIGATPWPYRRVVGRPHANGAAPPPGQAVAVASPGQAVATLANLEAERILALASAEKEQQMVKDKNDSPTLFATVDLLYWQLRRRDLDYAVSSLPGALVISGGEIHELEHPSDPGFRTVLGFEFATGWQIGFGFTMFDSEASGSAEDGLGTLYASRSHPDLNRRAGVADAESNFDMRILDLEVRNVLKLGERANLSLFGSFRWADIGQGFQVEYNGIEFPVGGAVTSLLDTQAFGLRIGADGKWAMSEHLYLVGTGETSILFSDNRLSLEETQGATTILDVSDSYEQALPVIGTRVGAGYAAGPLQIEMGYEMQAWFDLGDRMGFLDDQHLGIFSHANHNVLLDGYYFRLAWDR